MNKKIILNGIELSLPKYDGTAVTLFDYLDDIISNLEDELGDDDGNFQISIEIDFSASELPRHNINSNDVTKKSTEEKIAKALKSINTNISIPISGSVKVNLQVMDKVSQA